VPHTAINLSDQLMEQMPFLKDLRLQR